MKSLFFFGSDQYSSVVLQTLLESNADLQITAITDRPKPVGKGLVMTPSHVELLARKHNLKVSYYPTNTDEMSIFIDLLKSTTNLTGICASFDHLIPASIIEIFAGNLYNLHPSLLPQYRNVSPVQYAIAMGDTVTGITLFRISTGIDNGAIISQISEPILSDDTLASITPRLFEKGADLFIRSDLSGYKSDQKPTRSDPVCVPLIFTKRLTRDSGYIEWPVLYKLLMGKPITKDETQNTLLQLRLSHNPEGNILYDLLRALTPWPGIWSNVTTKKGELRVTLETILPTITLKLAGKANPITFTDFAKYYI